MIIYSSSETATLITTVIAKCRLRVEKPLSFERMVSEFRIEEII